MSDLSRMWNSQKCGRENDGVTSEWQRGGAARTEFQEKNKLRGRKRWSGKDEWDAGRERERERVKGSVRGNIGNNMLTAVQIKSSPLVLSPTSLPHLQHTPSGRHCVIWHIHFLAWVSPSPVLSRLPQTSSENSSQFFFFRSVPLTELHTDLDSQPTWPTHLRPCAARLLHRCVSWLVLLSLPASENRWCLIWFSPPAPHHCTSHGPSLWSAS